MYKVLIDELVFKIDFKRIDLVDQKLIIRTLRERLAVKPESYGRPLRGELKGYWKLRIVEYCVIYEIQNAQVTVYVIKVGFRRNDEVYRSALKRLG
jgi:mRNA interferase RelE/StbE